MHELERFVGVDWGSESHQVCVVDPTGTVLGERVFRHGGAGLAEMGDWIAAAAGAEPDVTGVAIEIPHGPVVETLMERGFAVHSINPKQLDRFRDRFSPTGAKDDRCDARVLGDALRTDAHAHNRLQDAVYHWANVALQHDTASRTKYVSLRARGHGHARALRSVADRLLAVACAVLERQTMFDPDLRSQGHGA